MLANTTAFGEADVLRGRLMAGINPGVLQWVTRFLKLPRATENWFEH